VSHNFPVFLESHTLMRSTVVCRLRALFHGSDFMTNDSVPLVSRTAIARNDHNEDQGCPETGRGEARRVGQQGPL